MVATLPPEQDMLVRHHPDEAALVAAAESLLAQRGRSLEQVPGAALATGVLRAAAAATALMDEYRRSGDAASFECLIALVSHGLLQRVRSRLRHSGSHVDPHEVLQDAIINIYRYPDRFLANKPGAFAAWSARIVDNSVHRSLRRRRSQSHVLSNSEVVEQQADVHVREPVREAEDHEECAQTLSAFSIVLQAYLCAYQGLSGRERFVLAQVEVEGMRYHQLAAQLAIRPEALKMVVFRARKRVFDRMAQLLAPACSRQAA
jgi:RNA polymerase sigma factor (sigma-70 family)